MRTGEIDKARGDVPNTLPWDVAAYSDTEIEIIGPKEVHIAFLNKESHETAHFIVSVCNEITSLRNRITALENENRELRRAVEVASGLRKPDWIPHDCTESKSCPFCKKLKKYQYDKSLTKAEGK